MRQPFRRIVVALSIFCAAAVAGRGDQPPRPLSPSSQPSIPGLVGLGSEWLSSPHPIGSIEDVTAMTGVAITGGVAYWATPVPPDRLVEHIAGRSLSGELHVFWWDKDGRVNDVNASATTGVRVSGSPIAWLNAAPRENMAAIGTSGGVTLFTWTSGTDWTATNISGSSGKTFTGPLVQWTTPATPPIEQIAATTSGGEIVVFRRKGDDPFSFVDVTAKTGVRARGLGGAWVVGGANSTEHLVAAGTDGKLYELVWSSRADWTALPIPLPSGQEATADLTAASETVALRTRTDALLVLSRKTTFWESANLSAFDGETVSGRPTIYKVPDVTFPHPLLGDTAVAVAGKDGEALVYWPNKSSPVWHLLSLTDLSGTGMTLDGAPVAFSRPETVAGAGTDHHLRVIRNFTEARTVTERLLEPFGPLHGQFGSRRTVTLLWNPEITAENCDAETGPGCVKGCDRARIGEGVPLRFLKSNAESVMQKLGEYYRENSGGLFSVENVATLGWYSSSKPGPHYAEKHAAGSCMDGWWDIPPKTVPPGDSEKWAEAIRKAAAEFDFGAFDTDGDKRLSNDELAVVIMIPREVGGNGGFQRPVFAEHGASVAVRGVTVSEIVEIYVNTIDGIPHLELVAHELSHHLFRHTDMYWPDDRTPPTALGALALMDGTRGGAQGHQDAFTKLKLGWLRPRILWHPGRYALPDVETHHRVRALLNPQRNGSEFLLFEVRYRSGTFDRTLESDGLAIYHVMQDPAVYQASRPPFHWSDAEWNKIGKGDWGHRVVRLIRPVSTSGYVSDGGTSETYFDLWSLWRAERTRTHYDLEPFPSTREHAWLRWGLGENPGLAIRDISASGPAMAFSVDTVSLANPTFCATKGKNCGSIDDELGGLADCGSCSGSDRCGGGGVPNVCGCTPNDDCTGRCGSIDRGCGLGKTNCGTCEPGTFCNRQNYCEEPPEPCECGGRPPRCLPCPKDPVKPGEAAPPPPAAEKSLRKNGHASFR